MMAWIAGAGIGGIRRYVWIVVIAAIVAVAVIVADKMLNRIEDTSRENGAQGAVLEGQEVTLGQVKEANDAEMEMDADRSDAKYQQCLQSSAEGFESHCERYRPNQPVPD